MNALPSVTTLIGLQEPASPSAVGIGQSESFISSLKRRSESALEAKASSPVLTQKMQRTRPDTTRENRELRGDDRGIRSRSGQAGDSARRPAESARESSERRTRDAAHREERTSSRTVGHDRDDAARPGTKTSGDESDDAVRSRGGESVESGVTTESAHVREAPKSPPDDDTVRSEEVDPDAVVVREAVLEIGVQAAPSARAKETSSETESSSGRPAGGETGRRAPGANAAALRAASLQDRSAAGENGSSPESSAPAASDEAEPVRTGARRSSTSTAPVAAQPSMTSDAAQGQHLRAGSVPSVDGGAPGADPGAGSLEGENASQGREGATRFDGEDPPDPHARSAGGTKSAEPVQRTGQSEATGLVERLAGAGRLHPEPATSAPSLRPVTVRGPAQGSPSHGPDGRLVAQSVMRGLSSALQQREGDVVLRLSPPSLGFVRIKLSLNHGSVDVNMETTTAVARQLVGEEIGTLRHALEMRGLHVERVSVQHSASAGAPAQGGGQAGAQSNQGQNESALGREAAAGDHDAGGAPSEGRREHRPETEQGDQESWDTHGPVTFDQRVQVQLETVA